MARIASSLCDLVGRTPLVHLSRLYPELPARLLGKLENMNPGASLKDRIGLGMIEEAEQAGLLQPGGVIIEPTSGNTGISLAWVAAVKGYRLILTMPEGMSKERIKILKAYNAEVILTPRSQGMQGAIQKAEELAKDLPGAYMPEQFKNPANPKIHHDSTGAEIWEDTDGQVDIFVAGVGTGGVIAGVGRYLKERNPQAQVVAVEPFRSSVLSGGQAGPHMIQGIGPGFIPPIYEADLVDEVIPVREEEATQAAQMLATREGILSGLSSGAVLHAALLLAKRPENQGKTIVTIICDTGERYLSTPLFED
ncbi:MAG: cysteine synthase A [Myxococcales bacterium]|nr:cysteine synthase A [Myxococcales bacterium]